jgi:Lrp/AsnC family transcriptional regulator
MMKQDIKLDRVDRQIIALLQEDSTLSNADLADQVGASSASCWRRVKSLEAAGVFLRSVRIVDPVSVGRGVNVMCNIRMRRNDVEARRDFEEFIASQPEIVECFSMSGDWDYLLRVVVADVTAYNAYLMKVLLPHPSVASGSSHFALAMTKFTTALPV